MRDAQTSELEAVLLAGSRVMAAEQAARLAARELAQAKAEHAAAMARLVANRQGAQPIQMGVQP